MKKRFGLTVAELAEIAGITRAQIHNYIKVGILSPARSGRNYLYGGQDVRRIMYIKFLISDMHLDLKDIKKVLDSQSVDKSL